MHKLAIVFPGQGSQSMGMFTPWRGCPDFHTVLHEASTAIDVDLWHAAQCGPAERLNDTRVTQPLMVAAGLAAWRTWRSLGGPVPVLAAGHSVGEIAALAASDALTVVNAAVLVRARAMAMAEALPPGIAGMAAVLGLDDATVEQLCKRCAEGDTLEPVNYNAPGQVVVAGHLAAIDRLKPAAREAGAKMVYVLQVSGPFHSSLMTPAADALAPLLGPLPMAEPRFGVLHNCDLTRASAASIKPALLAHLTRPVPWVRTIQAFVDAGITHVLELGPGEVLTNLSKRIAPGLSALSANTPAAMASALHALR